MELDEAIKHCEEKAEEHKKAASRFAYPGKAGTTKESADCLECAKEHEQLAGWLKELKTLKERPQGEWIIVDDTEKFIAKCSVCGRIEDSRMVKDYPFCHCGADMRGEIK